MHAAKAFFSPRFLGTSVIVASGAGMLAWNIEKGVRESKMVLCEAEKPGMIDSVQLRNQFRYMFSEAVDKATPGVVQIRCVKEDGWYSYESSGSGFVFEENGSIMTNAHVVQGARTVEVRLSDGTHIDATVENFDVLADVAILRPSTKKKLTPVVVGKSSELRVGEWVIVCGSPGSLQDSVSVGVVSALGRQSAELGMGARRMSYIQTDAAINHGNSGGPVVNLNGEVVGMSSMKAAQLEGIGFAIPIDLGMEIVRQLRKHGRVLRPYLGVKCEVDHTKLQLERPYSFRMHSLALSHPRPHPLFPSPSPSTPTRILIVKNISHHEPSFTRP